MGRLTCRGCRMRPTHWHEPLASLPMRWPRCAAASWRGAGSAPPATGNPTTVWNLREVLQRFAAQHQERMATDPFYRDWELTYWLKWRRCPRGCASGSSPRTTRNELPGRTDKRGLGCHRTVMAVQSFAKPMMLAGTGAGVRIGDDPVLAGPDRVHGRLGVPRTGRVALHGAIVLVCAAESRGPGRYPALAVSRGTWIPQDGVR